MRKQQQGGNYYGELVAEIFRLGYLPELDQHARDQLYCKICELPEAEAKVILSYYGIDRKRCDDFSVYATRQAKNVEICIRDFWRGMHKLNAQAVRDIVLNGSDWRLRNNLRLSRPDAEDRTLKPLSDYMEDWMCRALNKHGNCNTVLDLFIMERKGFSKTIKENDELHEACYRVLGGFFGTHWFPKGVEMLKKKGDIAYFEPSSDNYAALIDHLFNPEHVVHYPVAMSYLLDNLVDQLPEDISGILIGLYGLQGKEPKSREEVCAEQGITASSMRGRIDKIHTEHLFSDIVSQLELFSLSHDELLERALAQRNKRFDMIRRHLALVADDQEKQKAIAKDVSIDDLPISSATYRALKASRIYTLDEFIGRTDTYLLSIKGIGRRNLCEIRAAMSLFGLTVEG